MNYFDIKAVSNSSLSYINPESGGNPRLFRKFLDGQLDETTSKSFEIGTLIHEELLEPGKLDIVPSDTPGPKTQDIIDALWDRLYANVDETGIIELELDSLSPETWEAVIPADFYPKYTLQTKINRVVREGGMYWKALYSTQGKKIVDPATYHIVQGCIESIKLNEVADQLICKDGFGHADEAMAETEITFDLPWEAENEMEVTIPIKAKIDRILMNHKEKTITLVDLKTTAKPLGRFEETLAIYRYYRQLAWYRMCLQTAYPDYQVTDCYIVAVQTNKEYPAEAFKIDESYLRQGVLEYEALLDRIAFHMSRNNWGNSMETQMGLVQNLVLPDDPTNV
jgi:hypothetical protein